MHRAGEGRGAGEEARWSESSADQRLRVLRTLEVSDEKQTHLHEHRKRRLQVGEGEKRGGEELLRVGPIHVLAEIGTLLRWIEWRKRTSWMKMNSEIPNALAMVLLSHEQIRFGRIISVM